jgi:predicted porin
LHLCLDLLQTHNGCTWFTHVYRVFSGQNGWRLFQYIQLPETGGWLWVLNQVGFSALCLTLEKSEMKKSLIALAVLAASGAAMAQSSVTLYGRLDASIGQTSKETTGAQPVPKVTQTAVNGNTLRNPYWGLKGSEDLGGGLSAVFTLESYFLMDTGAMGNTLFEREANVGLAGGFGRVTMGRNYTAYDSLRGVTNNLWDSNLATTGAAWGGGVEDYTNRISNSIRYVSPDFSGFSGAVTYGFGENKDTATNVGDATDNVSLMVKYAAGPLLVGYAHQEEDVASMVANKVTRKYDLVAGSYDFGVAKLTGGFNQAKNGTRDDDEYQLGVSVPFGAATVGLGYAKSESSGAGLPDLDGESLALVGTYSLSKRTSLYGGYKASEVEKAATTTGINTTKDKTFAVGVVHLF